MACRSSTSLPASTWTVSSFDAAVGAEYAKETPSGRLLWPAGAEAGGTGAEEAAAGWSSSSRVMPHSFSCKSAGCHFQCIDCREADHDTHNILHLPRP